MANCNKHLKKTSFHRQRRARNLRAEKVRLEMKSKLSRVLSKVVESQSKASVPPSSRVDCPAPFAPIQTAPVRVMRPIPARACGVEPQSVHPVPAAQFAPMYAPYVTNHGTPVAGAQVPLEPSHLHFPPAPSAMSVRSSSGMQIEDDDGYNAQCNQRMGYVQHGLPTPRPTPPPSLMDVRTTSAMELEDDHSRMSVTPMPMPDRWILQQQAASHSDAHRLLDLQERYDVLRVFIHQLYHNLHDDVFQAAMVGGYDK